MTLRAFSFTFDAFSVELTTGFAGTILLLVIGSVPGMDVLTHTALAGVGFVLLKFVPPVVGVVLLIAVLSGLVLHLSDSFSAFDVITGPLVGAFTQTGIHALLAEFLGCFRARFGFRCLRFTYRSGLGFLLTLLD